MILGKVVNNRRQDLRFVISKKYTHGERYIELLKRSKTGEINANLNDKNWSNWREWKFAINIRAGGSVKLNALHVAIVMQNKAVISHILHQNDLKDYLKAKVERNVSVSTIF